MTKLLVVKTQDFEVSNTLRTMEHGVRARSKASEINCATWQLNLGLRDHSRASRVGRPETGCVHYRQSTCEGRDWRQEAGILRESYPEQRGSVVKGLQYSGRKGSVRLGSDVTTRTREREKAREAHLHSNQKPKTQKSFGPVPGASKIANLMTKAATF
jgi:hypothetical protein